MFRKSQQHRGIKEKKKFRNCSYCGEHRTKSTLKWQIVGNTGGIGIAGPTQNGTEFRNTGFQKTAVTKHLWNPPREQNPGLSCISLSNSLFILASKPTEVKTWYTKFLLQASKLSSMDQVARFYSHIQLNRTLKYIFGKKKNHQQKRQQR